MGRSGIFITSDTLTPGLRAAPARIRRGVDAAILRQVPRVESYARQNAPWHDQTGNARSGLHATPEIGAGVKAIELAHGVSYGIWLEIAHGGNYEIILPTIDNQGRELMGTLSLLMNRVLG